MKVSLQAMLHIFSIYRNPHTIQNRSVFSFHIRYKTLKCSRLSIHIQYPYPISISETSMVLSGHYLSGVVKPSWIAYRLNCNYTLFLTQRPLCTRAWDWDYRLFGYCPRHITSAHHVKCGMRTHTIGDVALNYKAVYCTTYIRHPNHGQAPDGGGAINAVHKYSCYGYQFHTFNLTELG